MTARRPAMLHVCAPRVVLLAAAWLALCASPAGASSVELHRLENGLEVLLKPEPGHEIVSVQTVYKVGSRDEGLADVGYGHLLEHLMSTGTEAFPDFRSAVQEFGGVASALSRRDFTLFQIDAPATAIDQIIRIEADRMRGLRLTEPVIQRTVDEVAAELTRLVYSAPEQFVRTRLEALAFDGHPYALPPLGSTGTTDPVTAPRVQSFYDRYYRPNNACLVIVGGFDPDRALQQVETAFGVLAMGTTPRPSLPALPPLPSSVRRRESVDLGPGYPAVAVAYRVPGASSGEADKLHLLTGWLSARRADWLATLGDTARLTELRVDLELEAEAGLLVVSALAGADPDRDADALLNALHHWGQDVAQNGGPGAKTLTHISETVTLTRMAGRATVSERARALAEAHVLAGDHGQFAHPGETVARINPAELAAAASSFLKPEAAVVVTVRASGP